MSVSNPVDIITVDASTNDNGFLGGVRGNVNGELTHTSLKDMVDKILAKLGPKDCIRNLSIVGHGQPGEIVVGASQYAGVSGKRINGNQPEWGAELGRLKSRLCKNAKVALLGCNTGICDKGANKLRDLANFLGVKVCGTTRSIYPRDFGPNGFTGGANDIVELSPGDAPGCRVNDLGQRVKKLKKLKTTTTTHLIDPNKVVAIAKDPYVQVMPLPVYAISDPAAIQAIFGTIDWQNPYEGDGVAAVVDSLLSVMYSDNSTESFQLILGEQAIDVFRDGMHVVYEITNKELFDSYFGDAGYDPDPQVEEPTKTPG